MIIDEKTENNTQSQGDDIINTPGISRENDHITPSGFIVGFFMQSSIIISSLRDLQRFH